MNRINAIRRIIILTAVVCGTALSQQSSFVNQTVTFGVTRSSHQMLANLFSAGSTTPSLSVAESANLREQHAAIAAKITVSAKPQQKPVQLLPKSSERASVGTSTSDFADSQRNEGISHTDLRIFAESGKTVFSNSEPLVITITE